MYQLPAIQNYTHLPYILSAKTTKDNMYWLVTAKPCSGMSPQIKSMGPSIIALNLKLPKRVRHHLNMSEIDT